MAHRKLQQEIDRVFKKINEGLEVFDTIHERHQQAENPTLSNKLEGDLKREVKKLQKLREQVKVWQASSEVKDKESLLTYRRRVEVAMEQYKAVERGSKVKAYSNTSLRSGAELDPEEKEKLETVQFAQDSIEELERQLQVAEAELEKLQGKKGKKASTANNAEKEMLKELQGRYRWHQQQLELALRLIENGDLDHSELAELKEDIEYFIEHNRDADFVEDEYLYESLDLDANAVVQKEITEGYGLNDTNNNSPSPAKQSSREATPVTLLSAGSVSTPKSKKSVLLSSTSSPTGSGTLRPAARPPPPTDQVKWAALAAGVDEKEKEREREAELKAQREKEQREKELKEQQEREQREKEQREREEREREEKERRDRELREQREREEREREERARLERERREKEREERERVKREEAERELQLQREKEKKRQKRLESYKVNNASSEPQQIIITGSSAAVLKQLEEQKRLEEEEKKKKELEQDPIFHAEPETNGANPLDESAFKQDYDLMMLPAGLQDVICSYYDSRRQNNKMISSVADLLRPPRENLSPAAAPTFTSLVELSRAQSAWSQYRTQLADLASKATHSPLSSRVSPHIAKSGLNTPHDSPSPAAPGLAPPLSQPKFLTVDQLLAGADPGILFYAFYYTLTPFETSCAEMELVKRGWRASRDKRHWFLTVPGTQIAKTPEAETASYKRFDSETWNLTDLAGYTLRYEMLA